MTHTHTHTYIYIYIYIYIERERERERERESTEPNYKPLNTKKLIVNLIMATKNLSTHK